MSKSDMNRDAQIGPSARANDPTATPNPQCDVSVYTPDSERKMASILKQSLKQDGLAVYNKKNPGGRAL